MSDKTTGWSFQMQGVLKDWPSVVDTDGTLLARTYGPNAEAVARKMAAADVMLAALKDAEKILAQLREADYSVQIELHDARAAIAAAEASGIKEPT
jgi:hypothetical protein